MNTLGPVVHDLGSIRRTSIGRMTFGVTIALGIVGVLFMILGLVVAFAGTRFADAVLAIALASILLVPGLLVMAFAIAMMIQLQRTRAVIHEHGLDLGQSWFRSEQVRWHDVVRIDPPAAQATWVRFEVLLRSGRHVNVSRLQLKPQTDFTGRPVPHPDVQIVLSHYAAWQQQAHGDGAPH